MTLVAFVTQLLATLTVIAQVAVVVTTGLLISKKGNTVVAFIKKHALLLSFILALVATAGSLFYSEVAGYLPCNLCWFQRIFMYPLVILFGVALLKKDRSIWPYGLSVSILGLLLAGYHYLGQLGMIGDLPCPVVGYSASCSKIFFMEFGYITFPLMAFTAFAAIALLQYINKKA